MKKRQRQVKRKIIKPRVKVSSKNIQDLRLLSSQLVQIIPATSFPAKSFCFRKIAEDNKLKKYWPKSKDINAAEAVYSFLKPIYRGHKKLFYKIIRESIPIGIEKRLRAGKPVLEEEIHKIDEVLIRLGINLTSEFRALNLPKEMPRIVPPISYFKEIPHKIGMHPFLLPDCYDLYVNGHMNESVRKALEKYEVYVQKKSGSDRQGNDLMSEVFNQDDPKIEIFDIDKKRGRALQDGFKLFSMGMMGFWRNYLSHGDEKQIPAKHAVTILLTVSHTMYVLDGDVMNELTDQAVN